MLVDKYNTKKKRIDFLKIQISLNTESRKFPKNLKKKLNNRFQKSREKIRFFQSKIFTNKNETVNKLLKTEINFKNSIKKKIVF